MILNYVQIWVGLLGEFRPVFLYKELEWELYKLHETQIPCPETFANKPNEKQTWDSIQPVTLNLESPENWSDLLETLRAWSWTRIKMDSHDLITDLKWPGTTCQIT